MSDKQEMPLVSAVIPTRNRPELVCRAVRSALNQTYRNLEVVVVVDGPDPATVAALEALHEPRLRIVALPENVGGSEARNIGAREARGEWIALLDDDDEWLPEKTSRQMSYAMSCPTNLIFCRYMERTLNSSSVMPRRFPLRDENWSEYLYCSGGLLLPSTYLVQRVLLLKHPFAKELASNQDSDWLLRGKHASLLCPSAIDECLTIYNCETTTDRISIKAKWESRYKWAIENREILLTKHALSYYLIRICLPSAMRSIHPFRNIRSTLCLLMRHGDLSPNVWVYFAGFLVLTPTFRHKLRDAKEKVLGGAEIRNQ